MKETILQKAIELFLNLGFKSVTMDDLANEMGISKKTIYTHFHNKTQLVDESVMQLFWGISAGIDQICAAAKNPIEELYEIKKFVMVYLKNERSSPQHQLQKYYPRTYEKIRCKQIEMMESCTVANIIRGIDLGIYRENLNIDFVSRIYFSSVMSLKDTHLFPPDIFPSAALQDHFLEYHIRGIATPKGRTILNTIINSNHE